MKDSGRSLIEELLRNFPVGIEKYCENFRITGVAAEIRKKHLQNTNRERCC
jgi:hypothetical protein